MKKNKRDLKTRRICKKHGVHRKKISGFLHKHISIVFMLFIIVCHIIACFMKGEGIIAQTLLAIPSDILMILVYFGVVKDHENDK